MNDIDIKISLALSYVDELPDDARAVLGELCTKVSTGQFSGLALRCAFEALALPEDERRWLAELLVLVA